MEKQLQDLGLTLNESKVYIYLLKKGKCSTGPIIKNVGISNSRVYDSLNSLILKGLVVYSILKSGKVFEASNPNKFLEIEEDRLKKIENLIPDLNLLKQTDSFDTNTAIYEGFEGFKTAFKKIIDDCPANEEIFILGFSEQFYSNDYLRLFLTNMNTKSREKKHKLKIILDCSIRDTFGKDRGREEYSQVKYMPEGYISPAAIDVFGDYVYIFLWDEKPFVFMIKNKMIANSFKHYFSFMWNLAKK